MPQSEGLLLPLLVSLAAMLSAFFVFNRVQTVKPAGIPQSVRAEYSKWKLQYGRLYGTPNEDEYRLQVFFDTKLSVDRSNMEYAIYAEQIGQNLTTPMFALNMFADLTQEEFKSMHTGSKLIETNNIEVADHSEAISETEFKNELHQDYLGADKSNLKIPEFVLNIKQQGKCGSCWAFSAIASLEKYWFDKYKQQIEFSQQELVDCDDGNTGCEGGIPEYAIAYIIEKKTIALEKDYPYIGGQAACKQNAKRQLKFPDLKKLPIAGFNYNKVQEATAKGYSVMVQLYSAGSFRLLNSNNTDVFHPKGLAECKLDQDHAVNAIAKDPKTGALLIQNSWGTGWANNGTKFMTACSTDILLGTYGRMAHLYN